MSAPLDVSEEDVFFVLLRRLLDAAAFLGGATHRNRALSDEITEHVRDSTVRDALERARTCAHYVNDELDVAMRRRLHARHLHHLARLVKPNAPETHLTPAQFEAAVMGAVRRHCRIPVALDLA